MKFAVSGKGGTGKTTLVSLLARAFRDSGRRVFAIDADSDSNLAVNLGLPPDTRITPLAEMHDLILDRTGAAPGTSNVFFTMNPRVDDIPEKYAVEHNGIKLMIMGTIRRGGSGCACPEHILVKELLHHLFVDRDEVVLLDTSAGIEHLGRGTAQYVDALIVVVQSTSASLQTYHRIRSMAADLKIKQVFIAANRIKSDDELLRIKKETGEEPIGVIPESASLADYHGAAVEQSVASAVASLIGRLNRLPQHEALSSFQ